MESQMCGITQAKYTLDTQHNKQKLWSQTLAAWSHNTAVVLNIHPTPRQRNVYEYIKEKKQTKEEVIQIKSE